MHVTRRRFLQGTAACSLLPASVANAQNGTARIYVGFAAGGTLDIIARRMADKLRGVYADPIIVEGRIGAGGRIAIDATKAAAPDGMSIVLSPSSPIVIFPHVYRKLSYDPVQDLIPVTPVCSNAQAFVVGPGVPESVRDLAQFVEWARVNKTFYATPAAGSIMHFQGMVFSNKANLDMTHAPYRGMAAIIPDLLSGTVATSMAVMGDVLAPPCRHQRAAVALHAERADLRRTRLWRSDRNRLVRVVRSGEDAGRDCRKAANDGACGHEGPVFRRSADTNGLRHLHAVVGRTCRAHQVRD